MNFYNMDKLKENADIMNVLDDLNIEYIQRGDNYFLYCPNPDHIDNHPTNCYFKRDRNNIYCTVCNKSYSAIDCILFECNCSVIEAAKRLWELEGCPEDSVQINESKYNEKTNCKQKRLFLTNKECRLLNITLPKRIMVPVEYGDDMVYLSKDMPKGYRVNMKDPGYLYEKKESINISDFMDVYEFRNFVSEKIREKMKNYKLLDKENKEILSGLIHKLA